MLLDGTDTELAPESLFRFCGARFPIEFALRDAKQRFHFNIVFAALFRAHLQTRIAANAETVRSRIPRACGCPAPLASESAGP